MKPETIGCNHGYEDGNGFAVACPECLERALESQREFTRIALNRAVSLRKECDLLTERLGFESWIGTARGANLRHRLENAVAAGKHFWRDRDRKSQFAEICQDDAFYHADLAARLAKQVIALELLAGEQGELIGRLRMAIPVDAPRLDL